ncbi:MAG: tRNA pseudouridine(38-40) synthase TruA, partial [Paludibacteraceae bacterium]|nr:tRNA pseudouridine(38-40) synthase TruA [Paludibacteraceae bacterium]
MRYLITFSYLGTNYHGWQIQPNGNTVQEELNKALSTLCREEISTTGAGRTDTGVHARMMTAHFDVNVPIGDGGQFVYRINKLLPKDIAVFSIKEVDDDFSARFSATERTYRYYITKEKDPFTLDTVAYIN